MYGRKVLRCLKLSHTQESCTPTVPGSEKKKLVDRGDRGIILYLLVIWQSAMENGKSPSNE